ncbi:hypothetical protein [Acrocarpospora sp. B8E8]
MTGQLHRRLTSHLVRPFAGMFSQDNRSLVTIGNDNTIRAWDVGPRPT